MENKIKIDNNVTSEEANWKFDSNVVTIFDEHVRKSVPLYDNFHKAIADLSDWFIEENTNVYDIGTSTGECIHNLIHKHKNKKVNYIGIDSSIDMVNKAKDRFKEYDNVNIINADITINDNQLVINNASFITSILTMQFIPERKRFDVIDKIYKGINRGSAFIMVEKIVGNNARFDEMFIELYHDMKIVNGLTEQEVVAKSRAIRGVMRPNTVEENKSMLKEAGFKDIDVFFKWCNFAGYIAIK
ncbi:MAG TPA: methyltransferase domain-containing protein [Candidatus Paceibacterota bacterium]